MRLYAHECRALTAFHTVKFDKLQLFGALTAKRTSIFVDYGEKGMFVHIYLYEMQLTRRNSPNHNELAVQNAGSLSFIASPNGGTDPTR